MSQKTLAKAFTSQKLMIFQEVYLNSHFLSGRCAFDLSKEGKSTSPNFSKSSDLNPDQLSTPSALALGFTLIKIRCLLNRFFRLKNKLNLFLCVLGYLKEINGYSRDQNCKLGSCLSL